MTTEQPRLKYVRVKLVCGDRMLLLQRGVDDSYPGSWCHPGGGIEPGETPQEAIERELLEETGLSPPTIGPLENMRAVAGTVLFDVKVEKLVVIDLQSEKEESPRRAVGHGWFTREQALRLNLAPWSRLVIEQPEPELGASDG